MRLCHGFVVALAVAPVAAGVACYGPTEMTVELSTDVTCAQQPRTAIFAGPNFTAAPEATAESCAAASDGSATLGSIAFVPSGDKDGRARVKIVTAIGQSPDACAAQPDACIVASRSFSYVHHHALHLPIRMIAECRGKQCPDGQTCVAGRACVDDNVSCTGSGCVLAAPVPPAPSSDAGARDAGQDAGTVLPTCTGPNGSDLVARGTGTDLPATWAFGDGFYVVYETGGVTPSIKKVTVPDGNITDVSLGPGVANGAIVVALAAAGSKWAAAWIEGSAASLRVEGGATLPIGDNGANRINSMVLTNENGLRVAYVARQNTVDRVSNLEGTPVLKPGYLARGAKAVAVDGQHLYIVDGAAGIIAYDQQDLAAGPVTIPIGMDGQNRFATDGSHVFVYGRYDNLLDSPQVIAHLAGAKYDPIIEPEGPMVLALAADADHVYWSWLDSNGAGLSRASTGIGKTSAEVLRPGEGGTRLDLAAYRGCVYYWTGGGGQPAELHVTRAAP